MLCRTLQDPAGGGFDEVVYLLSAAPVGTLRNCVHDTNNNNSNSNSTTTGGVGRVDVVSALTEVYTGEGAISIACEGNYSATLVVRSDQHRMTNLLPLHMTPTLSDVPCV